MFRQLDKRDLRWREKGKLVTNHVDSSHTPAEDHRQFVAAPVDDIDTLCSQRQRGSLSQVHVMKCYHVFGADALAAAPRLRNAKHNFLLVQSSASSVMPPVLGSHAEQPCAPT